MRTRLTRAERRQRTREELVDSAIRQLAEGGGVGVSLEAIAEAAGYSRGAYHSNFGSREELLDAVVARVVGDLGPQLAATLASDRPSLDRLAAYIADFLGYCQQHPVRARGLVAVITHRMTTGGPGYDSMVEASLSELVALFAQGQTSGEMRSFDRTLMAGVLRRALDVEGLRVAQGSPAGPIIAELVETFVRATRADPPES